MRHFLVGAKGLLNSTSVGTAWLAFPRRSSNSPFEDPRIFESLGISGIRVAVCFFCFFVALPKRMLEIGVHLHVYILSLFPTCQVRVVRFYVSLFSSSSSSRTPPRPPSSSSSCRDPASSVWRAGPQPRSCEFSVAARTPTAILWVQCGVPDPNRELVSSVWRPGPQPRSCEFSVACRTSSIVSENLSERMTEDMSERYVKQNARRYVRKICQRICQKECQKICQKDVRKNVRRYVRKNVKRYVRKNVKRYVRKNVRR